MILLLGDSNFRNTLDKYGETLSFDVKEKINFVLTTSNESMRTTLEKLNPKDNYKIIIFCAPMNEIVHKVKTGGKKGRDETIKSVVEEQNRIVNVSANTDGRLGVIHLLIPAFLRQDPIWMEERTRLVTFYMKDYISEKSPWNVGIGNPTEILQEDLGADKVHLTEAGMEKLYKSLAKDILKCKENIGEAVTEDGIQLSQDWASQVMDESTNPPRTPGTLRKRTRQTDQDTTDNEEEEEVVKKKPKKSKKNTAEDKMDKMFELMKEIKAENSLARNEVGELKDKVTTTDKKIEELRADFEADRSTELTAEMREDIDGLENENLRTVVIVRKLKAEKTVPKDKKALRTYVQDLARELAVKVLGNPNAGRGVKYAAMLYAFVDPTKKDNKEGLVPPFKICFHSKDQAVAFREKAVKLAKAGQPRRTFGVDEWEDMDQGVAGENAAGPTEGEATAATAAPAATFAAAVGSNYCHGAYFTFYQTAATRMRTTLMWAVADALKTKTKQVWVSQSNRPTLQIKEGGKVVKSLSFVQTMTEYKEKINQKTLDEVKKAAAKLYAGNLEKTFLVIKD